MSGTNTLVFILLVGIFAHSDVVAVAACVLLIAKMTNLTRIFVLLHRRGLEMGLLFLLLAILVPLAEGTVPLTQLLGQVVSPLGVFALAGGVLSTHLNSEGINLMTRDPGIVAGLVIGSILGIVFVHGVPVGPLTAASLAALFLEAAAVVRRERPPA